MGLIKTDILELSFELNPGRTSREMPVREGRKCWLGMMCTKVETNKYSSKQARKQEQDGFLPSRSREKEVWQQRKGKGGRTESLLWATHYGPGVLYAQFHQILPKRPMLPFPFYRCRHWSHWEVKEQVSRQIRLTPKSILFPLNKTKRTAELALKADSR